MKKYIVLLFVFLIISCKSKAVLAEGNAGGILTSDKIIENHNKTKYDFTTLYIKSSAKYKDDKQSISVSADIRIKKDEKILVSVRFLGFTVAKALITPNSVQYYEKTGGNYFEGDFAGISQWLGSDLDFYKIQNMFLGKALDDLSKGNYSVSIQDKLYKLEDKTGGKIFKSFYFESDNFLVKKQQISQPSQERSLEILYPDFKKFEALILPLNMQIDANYKNRKTEIDINYKSVTFNEDLSFPYEVPEGYERIYIKN